ncbi:MAG: bifunctional adenosylcobinamide kinase/adenosylcobinamide-phosphate guanylyltransferase [Lentisphaerae bacterium]|nr:bifunctional adenosylcobinamide kinase/adenosylcobinamide-phosphate guanylyltransferase [Lentisphaerota bacterium]
MSKKQLILCTGGVRSGKSRMAQKLAESFERPLFLATAEALDAEMAERIIYHKLARDERWQTVEEPLDIAGAINRAENCDVILLDCLTLWLGNILHKEGADAFDMRKCEFLAALERRKTNIILVTNEVGLGLVPDNELARRFRDMAGFLNQTLASKADTVVLMVSGLPLVIKGDLSEFEPVV